MPAKQLSASKSSVSQMSHLAASLLMSKSKKLLNRKNFLLLSLSLFTFPMLTLFVFIHLRSNPFATDDIPNIYILSNRRSGTHLTMDLLANILPPPFRLIKTNHVYLTNSTTPDDLHEGINCRCLNFLRRTGKLIHAHRDVRDVIISSFYYYHSYKAPFIRNLTMDQYLANKDGVRNMLISKWVNTTVPYFAQPDIFQLYYTESVSGFAHIQEKIAAFLGFDHVQTLSGDPRKLKSASSAVYRHGGKSDHGYKLQMSASLQIGLLDLARKMQEEKRNNMVHCPPQTSSWAHSIESFRDRWEDGFWIGGSSEIGVFAPAHCSTIMKTSKTVVITPPPMPSPSPPE